MLINLMDAGAGADADVKYISYQHSEVTSKCVRTQFGNQLCGRWLHSPRLYLLHQLLHLLNSVVLPFNLRHSWCLLAYLHKSETHCLFRLQDS